MTPITHNELENDTIHGLIRSQAIQRPGAIALVAPGKLDLTYNNLYHNLNLVAGGLAASGIRSQERVTSVLPGGAESALAFLEVTCAAVSAPLNPNYQQAEFEFYMQDLEAKALLTLAGYQTPARSAALQLGLPVIELVPAEKSSSTWFELEASDLSGKTLPAQPTTHDTALVLHTSGTTSRPKQVILTHANLLFSARNISNWLALTPEDRCLNIMPLFHIHGLMAALLASLSAGGSTVCTPGFQAPRFFEWMETFKPTWYTGVPTMHQAILGRAREHPEVIANNPLRFIRSSSSALPPQVMQELEQVFQAPVIEAYGMTEASHQMASNPLPDRARKPGSVGLPAGPQVSIMQEEGAELLPAGELGEIVIRGPNVTSGYHANPEANQKAFKDGWFRTGDQGYIDQDGYLFITGRLKELINRGGEKISPREVEETLLDHPLVTQAVVFALPDAQLGEEVAAAVVLSDQTVTEATLRQFTSLKLALFKVPKKIVLLDEIPKSATGKVQRIGLAQRLGLDSVSTEGKLKATKEMLLPRNALEERLQVLWCEVLGQTQVSVDQRFLDSGGDSMLATLLFARVQDEYKAGLTLLDFFDAQTIAEQATLIESRMPAPKAMD